MSRVKMLIRGNLKCKNIAGGGKQGLVIFANENEYDISEAVVIEGDVYTDSIVCDGLTLITGDVIIDKEV